MQVKQIWKNIVKEEKRSISLKASSSKDKVKDDEDNSNEDSSKDEEMSLFVKRYNNYMKRNCLKPSDKNFVKFKRSNPPRKWEYKEKKEAR